MRYAQHRSGQRLHLVDEVNGGVALRALCGKQVSGWRMTINLPLAFACRNCIRVSRAKNPTPRIYEVTA